VRTFSIAGFAALMLMSALGLAGCSGSSKQSSNAGPWAKSAKAPATYNVLWDTTAGPITIKVDRSLAPNGAQRLYELVNAGYYDGARFYRVVPGFVVQWGYAADPAVTEKWNVRIPDDPVKKSNTRGMVSFASAGPNSRTTHLFINLGNNARLDAFGFAPIGRVTSGMDNVERIYSGYRESIDQGAIKDQGNAYLDQNYPKLDYIKSARVEASP
jgi:peptidyl-prolyl cis-trans isomerase A (cyclophilin A)